MPPAIGAFAIDLVGATAGLVMFAPFLLLIALAVKSALGSPVLFRQVRPGLHGRPFELLKFRTMTELRDAAGELCPDGQRLTRFGRWLRSTSLDIPERTIPTSSRVSLSLIVRGCQPGRARRTSSWWMNISPPLNRSSTSGSATLSCGRLGPASDGTTVPRSSSSVSVKIGSSADGSSQKPCSLA